LVKQKRRSPDEKRVALAEARDFGRELEALLSHAAVVEYFRKKQAAFVTSMIACAPLDDEGRRACALKIQALLEFKQDMSAIIGTAKTAEMQLANMKDDDNAG
jgi:hypothetical protein